MYLTLFLLSLSFASSVSELSAAHQFSAFREKFHKIYSDSTEAQYRLQVFKDNLEFIQQRNSEQHSYVLGVTPFTDLTLEEFRTRFVLNSKIVSKRKEMNLQQTYSTSLSSSTLPQDIDWRSAGAVSSVKDQASCGSCWAFAAVGSIEGAYYQKTGKLVDLSPQYLVDCDYSDTGCSGGLMTTAFEYIMINGVPLESKYPYRGKEQSCKSVSMETSILGYYEVPIGNSYELQKAVNVRPVAVAIEAGTSEFQNYKSGVFVEDCGHSLDHGVLLVGYSLSASTPYYIIKNSWGSDWGENGYIRLGITDDYYGVCGINLMASYPFLDL